MHKLVREADTLTTRLYSTTCLILQLLQHAEENSCIAFVDHRIACAFTETYLTVIRMRCEEDCICPGPAELCFQLDIQITCENKLVINYLDPAYTCFRFLRSAGCTEHSLKPQALAVMSIAQP